MGATNNPQPIQTRFFWYACLVLAAQMFYLSKLIRFELNFLKNMVPPIGLEPTTPALRMRRRLVPRLLLFSSLCQREAKPLQIIRR